MNSPGTFQNLPPEIYWQLWGFLLEESRDFVLHVENPPICPVGNPRYSRSDFQVKLGRDSAFPSPRIVIGRTSIPLVLQICHGSRQFGLKTYKRLVLGRSFGGYFNFKTDRLLVRPDLFPYLGYFGLPPATFPFPIFERLQHIAFYFPENEICAPWCSAEPSRIYKMIHNLPGLRTITYILDREEQMAQFQKIIIHNRRTAPDYAPETHRREFLCKINFQLAKNELYDTQSELCLHKKNIYVCSQCLLAQFHHHMRQPNFRGMYRVGR